MGKNTYTTFTTRPNPKQLIDDIFFTGAYSVMGGEGRSAAGESGIVTQFESDYRQIDTSGAGGSVARGAPSAYTVDADTGQVLALSVAFGLVLVIAVTLMVLLLLEQRKRREAEKQVQLIRVVGTLIWCCEHFRHDRKL